MNFGKARSDIKDCTYKKTAVHFKNLSILQNAYDTVSPFLVSHHLDSRLDHTRLVLSKHYAFHKNCHYLQRYMGTDNCLGMMLLSF